MRSSFTGCPSPSSCPQNHLAAFAFRARSDCAGTPSPTSSTSFWSARPSVSRARTARTTCRRRRRPDHRQADRPAARRSQQHRGGRARHLTARSPTPRHSSHHSESGHLWRTAWYAYVACSPATPPAIRTSTVWRSSPQGRIRTGGGAARSGASASAAVAKSPRRRAAGVRRVKGPCVTPARRSSLSGGLRVAAVFEQRDRDDERHLTRHYSARARPPCSDHFTLVRRRA